MKDGLICGIALGMIAGALLYKYNPQTQDIVDNTEKAVKKEINSMQKSSKTKKTN